jgi:hypothetical protein
MLDILVIAITVAYFLGNVAFAWGCDVLMKEKK